MIKLFFILIAFGAVFFGGLYFTGFFEDKTTEVTLEQCTFDCAKEAQKAGFCKVEDVIETGEETCLVEFMEYCDKGGECSCGCATGL